MPTPLPFRPPPVRRLSWPQTVRFLTLIARVCWLDRRLAAAHRRVDRLGLDAAGGELLRLARCWLDVHQQIGAPLGIPEPPHVAQVRTTLLRCSAIDAHGCYGSAILNARAEPVLVLKTAIASAVLVALVAGFFLLPLDPVPGEYSYACPYTEAHKEADRRAQEAQDRLAPGPKRGVTIDLSTVETKPRDWSPDTYTETTRKSGLRKAIEGRMAWLGFDGELSFLDAPTCR